MKSLTSSVCFVSFHKCGRTGGIFQPSWVCYLAGGESSFSLNTVNIVWKLKKTKMVWTWSWLEELHENGFQLLINEQGGGGVLVFKTAWQRNINADTQLAPMRRQWFAATPNVKLLRSWNLFIRPVEMFWILRTRPGNKLFNSWPNTCFPEQKPDLAPLHPAYTSLHAT